MIRAYNFLANAGEGQDLYFIEKIIDRNGLIIFQHPLSQDAVNSTLSIEGFPWFADKPIEKIEPFLLLPKLEHESHGIDARVAFLTKDILREALQRGSNGRKTKVLNRADIAGKTGTTNDAISTWFSGFHRDLSATVWIGTDDFSSLGDNEFGSSIALPIWVDFMSEALVDLPVDPWRAPPGISYIRVDSQTGQQTNGVDQNSYFELFLEEAM